MCQFLFLEELMFNGQGIENAFYGLTYFYGKYWAYTP